MRSSLTIPSSSKRARRRSHRPWFSPNRAASASSSAAASAARLVMPSLLEPRHGLGPDPGDEPGRCAAEALAGLLAREHHEARRLLGVGGDLGDELVGPDADRRAHAGALADLAHHPPHRGARREQAGEVEVGLVEADDLDGVDLGPHDRHDPRDTTR